MGTAYSANANSGYYISGDASVSGDTYVSGDASMSGDAYVNGNATMSGNAILSGDATMSGNAILSGDALQGRDCSAVGSSYRDGSAGMTDVVLETYNDAVDDAKSRVGGYKYVTVSVTKSKSILATNNYSQTEMNEYYNKYNNKKFRGTCSEVAATILTEYYNRKGKCVIRKGDTKGYIINWKPYFRQYLNIAYYDLKIYDGEGTTTNKVQKLFKPFYKANEKSMVGDRDVWFVKDTIESYNKNGKPVLGNFEAPNGDRHSMIIAGYYDITVKYRNKTSESYKYKVYRYYVVNNGWKTWYSGNYRIQYIRAEYLKNGIVKLETS